MNGDGPLLSLDPSAEGVSYPPVLHGLSLDSNQRLSNADWEGPHGRRGYSDVKADPAVRLLARRNGVARAQSTLTSVGLFPNRMPRDGLKNTVG
jgi:hypothetical protein